MTFYDTVCDTVLHHSLRHSEANHDSEILDVGGAVFGALSVCDEPVVAAVICHLCGEKLPEPPPDDHRYISVYKDKAGHCWIWQQKLPFEGANPGRYVFWPDPTERYFSVSAAKP